MAKSPPMVTAVITTPNQQILSFVSTDLTTEASHQDLSSAPTWASGLRHTSPGG